MLLLINQTFDGFEEFKEIFNKQALAVFGSGWTFLATGGKSRLSIITTKNQDTVLPSRLTPLLSLDVWEHAYYLKYKNLRIGYTDNIWNIVNSRLFDHMPFE